LLRQAVQDEGLQGPGALDVAQTRTTLGRPHIETPKGGAASPSPIKGESPVGDAVVTIKTTPGSPILVEESSPSGRTRGR